MRNLFTRLTFLFVMSFFLFAANTTVYAIGDAGISGFAEPASPLCRGTSPVSVIVKNYGGITISTLDIHWQVNGATQPMYNYSGSITAGSSDTVVIGSYNFLTSGDTIVAWTSNPNGSADTITNNDTASVIVTLSSSLTGTYTIGGVTPDFSSFTAAVDTLIAHGVCGAVTFNMRADTDTMQIIIPPIAGADSNNTITFQAENGDSTSVILTYPSLDTIANNYLISLNGADYITFRSLTLERSGVNANGRVVVFKDTATHNTITHCRILGAVSTLPNSLSALLYSTSGSATNDSMNTFSHNLIQNGSIGVYMNGNSNLNLEYYTTITNNTFIDQYYKGIQMSNQGFAAIEDNTFNTASVYTGYSAIYLDRSMRPHTILRNKILGTPGTGIFLVDCTAQAGVHGVIANNFIHSNDSAGISVVNGSYQDLVFNSISMTGTTPSFSALFMRGTGSGKIVKNNILSNEGGGYSYVVSDSAVFGISASDHNNLFTTGSFVGNYNGSNNATLASWISASQKDSNSVAVNPNFVSTTDLHVTAIAMDDLGAPFPGITTDIDGETRSALTPDIGADEYASVSRNVGITGILSPVDSVCGDSTLAVTLIVSNPGGFPETGFDIVSEITGAITTTLTYTYSATIAPGTSDTITFAGTLNTAAGGTITLKNYTSLSVDDVHANDTLSLTVTHFAPSAAPTATNDTICGPGTGTLTAASPDSIYWYDNATGGTLLDSGATFLTPYTVASATYYAAASGGCEGPRTAVSVVVQPLPNVSLGADLMINQGDSTQLDAGSGFASYLWSGGDTTQTIWVSAEACYDVTVTNNAGCTGADTVCVNVVVPFDVGVTGLYSPLDSDCADDSVNVIIQVTNLGFNDAMDIPVEVQITGALTATFNDTIFGTLIPGADTLLNIGMINTSAGGTFTIHAYTNYINDLDATNDSLLNNLTIVVPPAPPAGIGASRCTPGTIVLISSASDSVYWFDAPTGGNLVYVGDNYVINNLAVTTTFYLQTSNYCNNQVRTPITATIHNPVVNLGNDTTANDSLVLDAGAGFATYTWSDSSAGQTLTVFMSDIYSVCVTDSNGCSACDTINVSIINAIEPLDVAANINLYPNPARTSFTVAFPKAVNGKIGFEMTDMKGSVVMREEAENVAGKSFNISYFPKGIYYLKIQTENTSSVYKLIIQ